MDLRFGYVKKLCARSLLHLANNADDTNIINSNYITRLDITSAKSDISAFSCCFKLSLCVLIIEKNVWQEFQQNIT